MMLKISLIFLFITISYSFEFGSDSIVTDYAVNDCLRSNNPDKNKYFSLDSNNFPVCSTYTNQETCQSEKDTCEPGLKCDTGTCKVDKTSCFKYYANVNGNECVRDMLWAPDCLEKGSWASKQCKGGTAGRCFCYNADGKRIFGDTFAENSANMTCACSRKKADLMDKASPHARTNVNFHCSHEGNYEELQCDSGHCWCSDPKTGVLTSIIVPEKVMSYLKCAKELKGSQYLRKCESQAYAQALIIEKMKRHGTTSPNIQIKACKDDGSYGPYTIQISQVYCVKENNAKMTYQSDVSNIQMMDCNCARDEDLYNKIGKGFNLVCTNYGSYKPLQSVFVDEVEKKFCVDKDGNKIIDLISSEKETDCDKLYNF